MRVWRGAEQFVLIFPPDLSTLAAEDRFALTDRRLHPTSRRINLPIDRHNRHPPSDGGGVTAARFVRQTFGRQWLAGGVHAGGFPPAGARAARSRRLV